MAFWARSSQALWTEPALGWTLGSALGQGSVLGVGSWVGTWVGTRVGTWVKGAGFGGLLVLRIARRFPEEPWQIIHLTKPPVVLAHSKKPSSLRLLIG